MKTLSNINWKWYAIIFGLFILSIAIISILLTIDIKKTTSAILEVDENKKFTLQFTTSNISLISSEKNISISLEGKTFYLHDVEFVYVGNNSYNLIFTNDDLYHLVKTNSLYNVNIHYGSKKIFEYLFNI